MTPGKPNKGSRYRIVPPPTPVLYVRKYSAPEINNVKQNHELKRTPKYDSNP